MLFRNKWIAHNEANPIVKWEDVDNKMPLFIRMWSLLTSWSSFGLCEPFRSDEQAFLGLEALFQKSEMSALKKERRNYLNKVKMWSKSYVHTREIDNGGSAFYEPKVTLEVIDKQGNRMKNTYQL
uniref:Uncharacterized protein n=1 Tax=Candidatus Kentrum sp. TUN TaxID=2126343 RepID=A0A451A892_9GAMM|nr:MAG: hypothetical protein BECKTUN1418D_GA0071000_11709 [Candidatus Kentron sp. TUN]